MALPGDRLLTQDRAGAGTVLAATSGGRGESRTACVRPGRCDRPGAADGSRRRWPVLGALQAREGNRLTPGTDPEFQCGSNSSQRREKSAGQGCTHKGREGVSLTPAGGLTCPQGLLREGAGSSMALRGTCEGERGRAGGGGSAALNTGHLCLQGLLRSGGACVAGRALALRATSRGAGPRGRPRGKRRLEGEPLPPGHWERQTPCRWGDLE